MERQHSGRLDRSLLADATYVVVGCSGSRLLYPQGVPDAELIALVYGAATTITEDEMAAGRGLDVRVGYAR